MAAGFSETRIRILQTLVRDAVAHGKRPRFDRDRQHPPLFPDADRLWQANRWFGCGSVGSRAVIGPRGLVRYSCAVTAISFVVDSIAFSNCRSARSPRSRDPRQRVAPSRTIVWPEPKRPSFFARLFKLCWLAFSAATCSSPRNGDSSSRFGHIPSFNPARIRCEKVWFSA